MITMTTFVGWLKEQEGRENDPVGWFAQFWRDLPDKPRLSAPASITNHLESRDLFRLTPGLTEAHDATLAEYRRQREGVVRAVASEAGVAVPPPPDQPPERGLAGQAVDRATEKAVEAAQRHAEGSPGPSQLDRIEAKLDRLLIGLGLTVVVDGQEAWGNPQGLPRWSWSDLYEQAAVYATARGAGWDEQEEA